LPLGRRYRHAAVLALALVGCRARIPFDEQAVFQPRQTLDAATFNYPNASFEEVVVEVEPGIDLYGWHITRADARHTVLYFGGQGFHLVLARDFVTPMLAKVPVNLFIVDYRGYGRSEGGPGVDVLKQDALELHRVLTEDRGVPPEQVIVHGHSMGSFVATHVAAEREVGALVLESPVTDVDGWTRALIPGIFRWFVAFDVPPSLAGESNLERVARIEQPSLFLVGSKDPITPPKLTAELFAASAATTKVQQVIEGGEHNGLVSEPVFIDAYAEFVQRLP
jgi:uncharacterized protein